MLRGSCLCGSIRYEIRGDLLGMYHCHCETCRKASGASFATNIAVPAESFAVVEGEELLTAYESSPKKHRRFCSRCGSPIYSFGESTKFMVSVRSGTLDDDPVLRPTAHGYVASKAAWTEITDALPQKPAGLL